MNERSIILMKSKKIETLRIHSTYYQALLPHKRNNITNEGLFKVAVKIKE